ncbi:MAG: alpha-ketoacid dehydrogenase subunit beta [Deltaproteobacteria bacterium]|nr:alpha-ketoacid dehydrogenase subunit beta [Deltaproteobacteria bacterium]
MAILNLVQSINLALRQEMERDPRVVLLGEDIGKNGGVFRVTEGLQQKFGEARVIDSPLSESGIVGFSIGMSVYGLVPVAEIQFMGFLYGAMEQILSHASRIRMRSRGRFHCPLVIRTPYGGGIHAPELHSESTEAFFVHAPGIKVVVPSTPYQAKGLLISAIRDPDPVLFLEPSRVYRSIKEEVPEEEYTLPLGEARIVMEGEDVTLVSWGAMLLTTLNAAKQAQEKGVHAEVIDLRTLYPLDTKTVVESVKKTKRAVIVHEAPKTGGLGAEIIARINEEALLHLEAPVERVTGYDTAIPLSQLESYYLPSVNRIIHAIEKVRSF